MATERRGGSAQEGLDERRMTDMQDTRLFIAIFNSLLPRLQQAGVKFSKWHGSSQINAV